MYPSPSSIPSIPFHTTKIGRQFLARTVPELVRQIERLNGNLERIARLLDNWEAGPDEQDPEE